MPGFFGRIIGRIQNFLGIGVAGDDTFEEPPPEIDVEVPEDENIPEDYEVSIDEEPEYIPEDDTGGGMGHQDRTYHVGRQKYTLPRIAVKDPEMDDIYDLLSNVGDKAIYTLIVDGTVKHYIRRDGTVYENAPAWLSTRVTKEQLMYALSVYDLAIDVINYCFQRPDAIDNIEWTEIYELQILEKEGMF